MVVLPHPALTPAHSIPKKPEPFIHIELTEYNLLNLTVSDSWQTAYFAGFAEHL